QRLRALGAARDALFVEVGAEEVDAVRSAEVVRPVAVEVAHERTLGLVGERRQLEALAHVIAKLKRHAVRVDERGVRDARLELLGDREALRRAAFEELGETLE